LPKSATNTLPEGSVVNPIGTLNDAAVPVPFAFPATPLPANVLTTPAGVILRIVLLYKSATYTFPEASLATAIGVLNAAAVPVPLILPATPLPAKVVTVATEATGSELLITVPQVWEVSCKQKLHDTMNNRHFSMFAELAIGRFSWVKLKGYRFFDTCPSCGMRRFFIVNS
jgi:hypothetical protein